jgi:hypothetical protein
MSTAETERGPWVLDTDPEVFAGGDYGGDIQIGEAYSVRWFQAQPDGTYRQVTRTFYGAQMDPEMYTVPQFDGAPWVELQIEYVEWSSDPRDSDPREGWTDYRYHVAANSYTSDEDSRWFAAQAVANDVPTDGEWDDVCNGSEYGAEHLSR